jgi:biotin synthase
VGDQPLANAVKMREAGFAGVYHALRLREGTDTTIAPERRRESIRNFQEAGLFVGTCVELVGPEHTNEEIAQMILYTASINPAYSGAARRRAIPGTALAKKGMISELQTAQIVAVTRLATPRTVLGNCTHEPCTLGAVAGANLFWAEMGANPRDTEERTEKGRGHTVANCRNMFRESGCSVLEGSSRFYAH